MATMVHLCWLSYREQGPVATEVCGRLCGASDMGMCTCTTASYVKDSGLPCLCLSQRAHGALTHAALPFCFWTPTRRPAQLPQVSQLIGSSAAPPANHRPALCKMVLSPSRSQPPPRIPSLATRTQSDVGTSFHLHQTASFCIASTFKRMQLLTSDGMTSLLVRALARCISNSSVHVRFSGTAAIISWRSQTPSG